MTDPRAFISFDFDHNETQKNMIVGQSKHSETPFSIEDWSSKEALPQDQWEALIKGKINRCNMLIVLVGQTTASATGVLKEISMAKNQNVPVFGIYVDIAKHLPTGLTENRIVEWTWDSIANAIDKMMGEGKNK